MREYEREVELYDYIEVLLKYKWFILVATLVCGGIGWVLRPAPTPPLYEADAVLMIKSLPSTQTGGQAEIPTGSQTSGFYNSLALADDLKQALIDSLNLNMSVVAMDGILGVQVLDPGVRLTVQSNDPDLPIKLVNKWAQLFVERNGDLNGEVVGSYYDYVQSQYDTARTRLNTIESQLHQFEAKNSIEFLHLQRSILDSAAINIYREIADNNSELQETKLDSLLAQQNTEIAEGVLNEINEQTVGKVALASIQTAQARIDSELAVRLAEYDEKNHIELVYKQQKFLEEKQNLAYIDTLQLQIANLEKEAKIHPAKIAGEPNPTLVELNSALARMRLEYATLITQQLLKATTSETSDLSSEYSDLNFAQINQIIDRRKEIIVWYSEKKREAKYEIIDNNKKLVDQLNEARDHALSQYLHYKTTRDSIANRRRIVKLKQQNRKDLLNAIKEDLDAVKDTLSNKMNEQQRLMRDQSVYSETVARFSKLLEEARIAREKAAGDIRILTRALQVRPIPQEQGRHKATVAAGVGFLLSCILSLLTEYIRKAQQRRLSEQK
jgi:uncharacterized protein involved in exopolysaccharide biosynthesis